MNIKKREAKYLEIAKFLCTEVGTKKNGKPRYRTLEETAAEFDFSFSHTSRLKTALVNEIEGIRSLK